MTTSLLSRTMVNLGTVLPTFVMATALGLVTPSAFALKLIGEVVAVADGDTVTVLDSDKQQHRIRLAGIDAPEKRQAFGNRSRQALASMVFRQHVTVDYQKTDRYGRLIGKVFANQVDINLKILRIGLAWHYKDYQGEQSVEDRAAYSEAESTARNDGVGLWQDQNPMPPWEFRRQR